MWQDEILEEIHRIREKRAKYFNYDIYRCNVCLLAETGSSRP